MTRAEIEAFTSALRAKETELSRSLDYRDAIVIECVSETLDAAQLMVARELAIQTLDRDSNTLRQVRGALSRISKGTYGACLHCDEDIQPKRLAALPWAGYCFQCQEQIDRHEIEVDEQLEELASAA